MNLTIGMLGMLGFITYEVSFLLSLSRHGSTIDKRAVRNWRYIVLVFVFAMLAFIVTCIFGVPDLAGNLFPVKFDNVTIAAAARAFLVGVASVHLYKTTDKFPIPNARVETSRVNVELLSFKSIHRWWKQ